jgi:hypothetical protein
MFVDTCCCILFCIEWFVSKVKREFKTCLKICFGNLEKKKKEFRFLSLSFSSFDLSAQLVARSLFSPSWPAQPTSPLKPEGSLASPFFLLLGWPRP